ncbi:MAG: hypothetical protein VW999_03725 [Alphaproteobacteria bacterium]
MNLAATLLRILLVISAMGVAMVGNATWPVDLYLVILLCVCAVLAGLVVWISVVALGHWRAPGQMRTFDEVLNGLFDDFLLGRFVSDHAAPPAIRRNVWRATLFTQTPGRRVLIVALGALVVAALLSEALRGGPNWIAAILLVYAVVQINRMWRRHRSARLSPGIDALLRIAMAIAFAGGIVGMNVVAGSGWERWWLMMLPGCGITFANLWLHAGPEPVLDRIANVFD